MTRSSLASKVAEAVAQNGTLDIDLGTSDTPWVPGTPLTLRGLKALNKAALKAAPFNFSDPLAELIAKIAPLLVTSTTNLKRTGKLTLSLYDDAQ